MEHSYLIHLKKQKNKNTHTKQHVGLQGRRNISAVND